MPLTAPNTINPHSAGPVESCISNAYNAAFGIPPRVKLQQFDGSNWPDWSGTFKAILTLYKAEDHLCYHIPPFYADSAEWANVQWWLKAYLCLYMSSGVYSQISDEFAFLTINDKWDELKCLYFGDTGSTTVFNSWIVLTQACLDENQPLGPQLTKLNEACVTLANAKMGVSDTQYCFILLHTLPNSYEMLTSTILALGNPTNLHPSDVVTHIQNEEGHRNGGSTSLNAITPIKGKTCCEMFHLSRGQGLGEGISNHVIGQAIDDAQGALLNDPLDEVVAHVNVLYVHMVLVIVGEHDGCLVI